MKKRSTGEVVSSDGVDAPEGLSASNGIRSDLAGYPCLQRWNTPSVGEAFSGVAQDARFLADCIEARYGVTLQKAGKSLNELALGS